MSALIALLTSSGLSLIFFYIRSQTSKRKFKKLVSSRQDRKPEFFSFRVRRRRYDRHIHDAFFQRREARAIGSEREDFNLLFRIDARISKHHSRRHVGRCAEGAHAQRLSLEILDRFKLCTSNQHMGRTIEKARHYSDG